MIWRKSKKAIQQLLADSVKDHVDFHMTRYGPGVSYFQSRAWITWDGNEIARLSNNDPKSLLTRDQFENSVEVYLGQSIDKSISSDDAITKSLALFDRRIGKRRLKQFHIAEAEHPLVRQFYDLRCRAEGFALENDPGNEDLT